jgi:2,3-bisphosphoglycerate-dependent phosphoglycerate mutase
LKEAGYKFDVAHTSLLTRAQVTLNSVLEIIEQTDIPIQKTWRLNERHYGGELQIQYILVKKCQIPLGVFLK